MKNSLVTNRGLMRVDAQTEGHAVYITNHSCLPSQYKVHGYQFPQCFAVFVDPVINGRYYCALVPGVCSISQRLNKVAGNFESDNLCVKPTVAKKATVKFCTYK
jgi:hypothetical protein